MTAGLIIHQSHKQKLAGLAEGLPHALLLTGQQGVGLMTIATSLTSSKSNLIVKPKLQTKSSTIAQIGIDDIRQLYEQTKTKGNSVRCVIIDDADTMTTPAQNSLLKLLEEPNMYTKFILTSHNAEKLLVTIRSRSQEYNIRRAESGSTDALLVECDESVKQQIRFIADGLPAEVKRLISDKKHFTESVAYVSLAKKLLEADRYEAAAEIIKMTITRPNALSLIEAMIKLLTLRPDARSIGRIKRLVNAYEAISSNGHIKLLLTNAVIQ